MQFNSVPRSIVGLTLVVATISLAGGALAFDADSAKKLAKKNDCTKCHAVDKDKKGPGYKKLAAKYKGKADAEATLTKSITTGPKVKLTDGTEEDHKIVDTKDPGEIKNLVQWILSL